jgi:hypothetical protein
MQFDRMKRREFITLLGGAAALWPLAVRAQQGSRMPGVGVLLAETDDRGMQERLAGLRQGLERLGWSDGRNIRMVYRFCEGKPDRFQPLAKELVAMQSDLIVAQTWERRPQAQTRCLLLSSARATASTIHSPNAYSVRSKCNAQPQRLIVRFPEKVPH